MTLLAAIREVGAGAESVDYFAFLMSVLWTCESWTLNTWKRVCQWPTAASWASPGICEFSGRTQESSQGETSHSYACHLWNWHGGYFYAQTLGRKGRLYPMADKCWPDGLARHRRTHGHPPAQELEIELSPGQSVRYQVSMAWYLWPRDTRSEGLCSVSVREVRACFGNTKWRYQTWFRGQNSHLSIYFLDMWATDRHLCFSYLSFWSWQGLEEALTETSCPQIKASKSVGHSGSCL